MTAKPNISPLEIEIENKKAMAYLYSVVSRLAIFHHQENSSVIPEKPYPTTKPYKVKTTAK